MMVVGLTGSIGTGKTTVTEQFAFYGAATLDSDEIVHKLLGPGGEAVKKVAALFPETLDNDHIDRRRLGAEVFGKVEKLKQLEALLHPLVRAAQERVIRKTRKRVVVLDIPLLFETRADKRCDKVVVTTAPHFLQKQRVLRRPGMTEEKFLRILAAQMPDFIKRRRGDFVVHTGLGKAHSFRQMKRIFLQLQAKNAEVVR